MAETNYAGELRSFDYSLQSVVDTAIKAARDCFITEEELTTIAEIITTARYNLACEVQEVENEEAEDVEVDEDEPVVAGNFDRFCD